MLWEKVSPLQKVGGLFSWDTIREMMDLGNENRSIIESNEVVEKSENQ